MDWLECTPQHQAAWSVQKSMWVVIRQWAIESALKDAALQSPNSLANYLEIKPFIFVSLSIHFWFLCFSSIRPFFEFTQVHSPCRIFGRVKTAFSAFLARQMRCAKWRCEGRRLVMTQIWCWPSSALDAFCQARIRQVLHHSSYSFRMFPITLLIWLMIDLIDSHTHIVCLFISLRQSRRLLCGSHNMSSSAGTTSSATTVAPAVPPSKAPGLQTPAKQQRHHNNNHRSQVIAIAEPLEAKTQNNFPLDTRAKL